MSWFLMAMKKYAVFSGRSQRSEYWYFALFYLLIYIVAIAADLGTGMFDPETGFGLLSTIVALAMIIPSLSVSVRRLHDIGRTGWWVLIGLVPLIGAIVLIVFFVMDSQPGSNEYGPNPKEAAG